MPSLSNKKKRVRVGGLGRRASGNISDVGKLKSLTKGNTSGVSILGLRIPLGGLKDTLKSTTTTQSRAPGNLTSPVRPGLK